MTDGDRALFEGALRLPSQKRADLAAELLQSLDDGDDVLDPDEAERRWGTEITRRAERARRGEGETRDAFEALREIEAKLKR